MVAALDKANLGERWVVRHRLLDGSATDVIGWIDGLNVDTVSITPTDGSTAVIGLDTVIVARRAPAAAGGPDSRRIDPEIVQHRAVTGWLAHSEPLGDWVLRSAGGFTGRANSCLAVGSPGVSYADAATSIRSYADRHQIPPMAQVITGSTADAELRRLGWVETYLATRVLTVRLADVLGGRRHHPRVRINDELSEAWQRAYQQSRPNTADKATLRMILDGRPPRAFAAVADRENGGEYLGIARGHRSDDWLGLASIWTRPDHRRHGWATNMIMALGHWAARQGARYAYLQVAVTNESAIAAYQRLGFVSHHRYHYLAPLER